jgi:hypothetical protein
MQESSFRWRRCVEILTEMGAVLSEHGHYAQVEVTDRLSRLATEDGDRFVKELQGVDVWGGAGALWDTCELGVDKRRYWTLVIALAGAMAEEGIETERAWSIAKTFSEWLAA